MGRKALFYGGRPSATALTRDSVPQNDEDLERLAATAAIERSAATTNAPKPGDGTARAPGMFLHKLNPYQGLDEAGRKALIEQFRDQEESWGNRDLRLALMDEQGINAAVMFPGIVLTLEVEFQDDVDAIYANTRAFNRWIYDQIGYNHAEPHLLAALHLARRRRPRRRRSRACHRRRHTDGAVPARPRARRP